MKAKMVLTTILTTMSLFSLSMTTIAYADGIRHEREFARHPVERFERQQNMRERHAFGPHFAPPYYHHARPMRWRTEWIFANNGYIPPYAVVDRYEYGSPIYVCQAVFHGGLYRGRIIGQACHFAYAGREVLIPHYNMLLQVR